MIVSPGVAQLARVGINTMQPKAALHVADSSVVFTGASSYDLAKRPPVEGQGSRMMWFTDRWAFRAGYVSGNRWDRDSIGLSSFAVGFNTCASGDASSAFGYNTVSYADYSTAFGYNTLAGGLYSLAAGRNSRTFGSNSIAMGNETMSNTNSAVFGNLCRATGINSFAVGDSTKALGNTSAAFGKNTKATGSFSTVFGNSVFAKSYNMFALGAYNDTTNMTIGSWVPTEPLFVIGNGTSNTSRKNALTLLKNGNLGLGSLTPTFRLHVVNDNPENGGYVEGIIVENTNTLVGEAAISFRNKSIPSNRQWTIGLNQNPSLAFCYGTDLTGPQTKMHLDTLGRLGLNTTSPQAHLHVKNSTSGGPFFVNAIAIFESSDPSYIQFSNENADEAGILSGNQDATIRSGIVFRADSSIQFRAGGNNTRIVVSKTGNVGIGTTTPVARLDVNGTCQFGVNGSTITEIIKETVNNNLPSIPANGSIFSYFNIPNASSTSAVSVSPVGALENGLVIAYVRVSSSNTVEVRFVNTTASSIDPDAMDFHFVVIR